MPTAIVFCASNSSVLGGMQLVNVLKKAMAEITLLTFCLPKFLLEFVPF